MFDDNAPYEDDQDDNGMHIDDGDQFIDDDPRTAEQVLKDFQDSRASQTDLEKRANRHRTNTEAWKSDQLGEAASRKRPNQARPDPEAPNKTQDVLRYIDEMEPLADWQNKLDSAIQEKSFTRKVGDREYTFVPDVDAGDGKYVAIENPNIRLRKPLYTTLVYKDEYGKDLNKPQRIAVYPSDKIIPDSVGRSMPIASKEQLLAKERDKSRKYREKKGDHLKAYAEAHQERRAEDGYWEAQHQQIKEQRIANKNRYEAGNLSYKSGKVELGPSEERIIKTHQWELVDDKRENKEAHDKLVFKLGNKTLPYKEVYRNDEGERIEDGVELRSVLSEMGIRGVVIDYDDQNKQYVVSSEEGKRINPAHAAAVKKQLESVYGLQNFERQGPAMRMKTKVIDVNDFDRLTDGEKAYDYVKQRSTSKLGNREIQRDPLTGEVIGIGGLKDGETDRIGTTIRLPGQKQGQILGVTLKDDTDAIGWGTSYRPGSKEVNDFLMAGAKQQFLADAYEATEAAKQGDDSLLTALAIKQHPDMINNDGTFEQSEMEHHKNELRDVGAASIAAAAYTARKNVKYNLPKRVVHARGNRFGKYLDDKHVPFLSYDNEDYLYINPLKQKMDRGLWRVAHPLRDPMRPDVHPIEVAMPELSRSWKLRPGFTELGKTERRNLKQNFALVDLAQSRDKLRQQLEQIETNPATSRKGRLGETYTLSSSQGIIDKSSIVDFDQKWPNFLKSYSKATQGDEDLKYLTRMGYSVDELAALDPESQTHLAAHLNTVRGKRLGGEAYNGKDLIYLRRAAKGLKYGAAVGAVGAASIYAYDKYKGSNKGAKSNSLWQKVPEKISYPKVAVRTTKHYSIPTNAFTDALDIEGRDVPIRWKAGIKQKKVIQIRNRKDVSGDTYRSGPLVGNVGVSAEAEGSWLNSIQLHQKTEKGRHVTKPGAVVVKGKELPIHLEVSGKNRYKRGDLSTKNPNKLDQEQREKIAMTIIKGGPVAHDMEIFYGDDEKIMTLVNDEAEKQALLRKYDYLYTPPGIGDKVLKREIVYTYTRDPVSGETIRLRDDEGNLIPKTDALGRVQTEVVHDEYGNPVYEPRTNQTDRPYRTGKFSMTQGEQDHLVQEAIDRHYSQQRRNQEAFNRTLQTVGGKTYATAGESRTKPGSGPELARSDLESQRAEQQLSRDDRERLRRMRGE